MGKVEQSQELPEVRKNKNKFTHLKRIFSTPLFLKPHKPRTAISSSDDRKVLELNIDENDIKIDEPLDVSSSSEIDKKDTKDKETEREILLEGSTSDDELKPRLRTAEEVRAMYRKEDPAIAAARAKEKLGERGEKLERLSQRTEELQSGAEDFASMANELAKQMEKRNKWWNI